MAEITVFPTSVPIPVMNTCFMDLSDFGELKSLSFLVGNKFPRFVYEVPADDGPFNEGLKTRADQW